MLTLRLRVMGARAATDSIGIQLGRERGGIVCFQYKGEPFLLLQTDVVVLAWVQQWWKKVGSETGWLFAVKIRPL
jgi:hypothetical protein